MSTHRKKNKKENLKRQYDEPIGKLALPIKQ
jgi:hypothetical protein